MSFSEPASQSRLSLLSQVNEQLKLAPSKETSFFLKNPEIVLDIFLRNPYNNVINN